MTVREFTELFVEENHQKFIIFDLESGEDVFNGYRNEMSDKLLSREVSSLDNISYDSSAITINARD